MKKGKQFLSGLVALIIMVSLAACGGGGGAPQTTAPAQTPAQTPAEAPAAGSTETNVIEGASGLTLRLTWIGDGQNKAVLDECLRKYTDKTGIGIETIFVSGNWADYFTKIQTMIAGGEVIDNCNVAIEGFEMLVRLGLAAPIDSWIAANQDEWNAVANDIAPNVMQIMNFDGKQYGAPGEWNNVVTHMNTILLEEAGLDVPPPNWTKEMFLEYCEKLTKDKPDGTKQYGTFVPNYYFGFEAWLFNNNAAYMTDDFKTSLLLDPNVIEMFQFMYDLIHVYGYAPIPEPGMDTNQMLQDQVIASFFAGRWPSGKYHADGFKDVVVQYIPNWKTNVVVWGGTGVFTMKDSPNFDEATRFGLYLASEPFVDEWLSAGAIPVLQSVAEKNVPALGVPQNNKIYIESAALAKAVHSPAQYAECANLMDRVFSDILVNKMDIVSTLEAADAELNMILMDNR